MKKLALILALFVLFFFLPLSSPRCAAMVNTRLNEITFCQSNPSGEDVRMVAAQIFFVEGSSPGEIEEYIRGIKSDGINTILLRVFQNRGDRPHPIAGNRRLPGVYFQTDHAPVIADLLKPVVDIAHRYEIKVFAWMSTRHCDWQLHRNSSWRDMRFNSRSRSLEYGELLDLFNPEMVDYLVHLYRDLARYPIDGILLQDDLISRSTEGYSPSARRLYYQKFGKNLHPEAMYILNGDSLSHTPDFWQWAAWKSQYLLSFAESLREACREVNPALRFSLNVYYDTLYSPRNALAWLSQDLSSLLSSDLDYLFIMSYHRQMKRELSLSLSQTYSLLTDMMKRLSESPSQGDKVVMKLQMRDWTTGEFISFAELNDVLQIFLRNSKVGIALVPYIRSSTSTQLLKIVTR
ncbi:MAG: poly-beta-1,6-N-acetyl-D-glucosamine N-deacetylase PgaB [Acidobacteriota bacterium]